MEPVSAIALSLALGAGGTAGTELVKAGVGDAYAALKRLIAGRYPQVSIEPLERKPDSKSRRAVVEEDLADAGAGGDADVLAAARALIELVRQHAPGAAGAIGVDLKDVAAANLRLADIVSSGTGVVVQRGTFSGDIDIRGVRAGQGGDPPKQG